MEDPEYQRELENRVYRLEKTLEKLIILSSLQLGDGRMGHLLDMLNHPTDQVTGEG